MKNNGSTKGTAGVALRLLAAFTLLMGAFSANGVDCFALYSQSGATPGSRTCKLDVVSNTPGGMGNYACINDLALVDQWCNSTETLPDDTCPVADPVFAASGAVTLVEADFISGDELPVTFTRTYRSSVFLKTASSIGSMWFHSWQRQLNVTGAAGGSGNIVAYRANGEPLTFGLADGVWRTKSFSGLLLTRNAAGWALTDLVTENTETYSSQGVLLSEATKTGFIRALSYDGSGRLVAISQHG
ncbi:DUF6531 domain-containing protein [Paraburkholderia aromaticivorans]|nr:DUF6531 domain-containing protein [Paraburkholderia aromaticivorans]